MAYAVSFAQCTKIIVGLWQLFLGEGGTMTADNGRTVMLALQGGGALGAYQVGAYKAMAQHRIEPDWVAGISIGAINAAIIAGNAPNQRVARLEELWSEISRPQTFGGSFQGQMAKMVDWLSFGQSICFGQPNFYAPRIPGPMVTMGPSLAPPGTPGATSYYNTDPMIETLGRLAFNAPKAGGMRLTVGATSVTDGTLKFFDSKHQTITPAHVLASGSLPPGFPAIDIDGTLYWDGGCVANTPLDAMISDPPTGDSIAFIIDLWNPNGPPPKDMNEVAWRQKEIQYASRTQHSVGAVAAKHHLQRLGHGKHGESPTGRMDIVHIIYNSGDNHIPFSDADFGRSSLESRSAAGFADMEAALKGAGGMQDWLAEPKRDYKVAVHEVTAGKLTGRTVDGKRQG
jgi:NTE family protein